MTLFNINCLDPFLSCRDSSQEWNFKMKKVKQYYLWVDLARILAIFLVVLDHVNEHLNSSPVTKMTVHLELLGRLGVPIFITLTGFLMINRSYQSQELVQKFLHHNLLPIIYSAIFWCLILSGYHYFFETHDFNLLKKNIMLEELAYPHLWYIVFLPFLYLWIPLLSMIKKVNKGYLLLTIVGPTLILMLTNFIGTVSHYHPLSTVINGTLMLFLSLIALMVVGSYLNFVGGKKIYYLIFFNGLAVVMYSIQLHQISAPILYHMVWYSDFYVFIWGLSLTVTILKLVNTWINKIVINHKAISVIQNMGSMTYGFYLLHYPILNALLPFLHLSGVAATFLIDFMIFVLSYGLVFLVSHFIKLPRFIFLR